MKTKYVKALPKNLDRFNKLLNEGFKLYLAYKEGDCLLMVFVKD